MVCLYGFVAREGMPVYTCACWQWWVWVCVVYILPRLGMRECMCWHGRMCLYVRADTSGCTCIGIRGDQCGSASMYVPECVSVSECTCWFPKPFIRQSLFLGPTLPPAKWRNFSFLFLTRGQFWFRAAGLSPACLYRPSSLLRRPASKREFNLQSLLPPPLLMRQLHENKQINLCFLQLTYRKQDTGIINYETIVNIVTRRH